MTRCPAHFATLHLGNKVYPCDIVIALQQVIGNSDTDLAGAEIEPQTSRARGR